MANPLDLDTVMANLSSQVEHWNACGSGFVLHAIKKFVIVICKYRPLQGSSWVETPSGWPTKKQQSTSRTLLTRSLVHPVLHSSCPISSRTNFQLPSVSKHSQLFRSDISNARQRYPKFEEQNPSISVNVLCKGDDDGLVPLYVSKERDRRHHVNLFLIEGPDNKHHYVWIKSTSLLVAGRTSHQHKTHVCNYCLQPFSSTAVLDQHVHNCQRHSPQVVRYPNPQNPTECVTEFSNKAARFSLPFCLVCDFESFLSPLMMMVQMSMLSKQRI